MKADSMLYLFIGGCKDGKQIDVLLDAKYMAFPIIKPGDLYDHETEEYPTFECDSYRLEEIRTANTAILFYVLDSLTIDQALRMLFDFYTKTTLPCAYCFNPTFKGWIDHKCPYCGKNEPNGDRKGIQMIGQGPYSILSDIAGCIMWAVMLLGFVGGVGVLIGFVLGLLV